MSEIQGDQRIAISRLQVEGPAYEAGIQAGDIIVSINHEEANEGIQNTRELIRNSYYEEIMLTVERDGEYFEYSIQSRSCN
ncbi:MAG: PDZ domain-containing protein [Oscillospiraceae bacterium]|nr:PDZ domain-containing protein [Oscillospiraceae bacterium]